MMQQVVVSQQTGYARNASESAYPNLWRGLVGWWLPSVNPRGGNRLFDLSPFRNHGTLTNMTNDDWVVSGGAGALDFDGSDDFGDVSATAFLGGSGSVTLSAFAYAKTLVLPAHCILTKMQVANDQPAYSIAVLSDGRFYFLTTTGSGFGVQEWSSTSSVVSVNTWYHLAFTYTWGSGTSLRAYVNGLDTAGSWTTGNGNVTFTGTTALPIRIGRLQHTGVNTFFSWNGILDDIRIYNRSLTHAEIRLLASKRGIGLQPRPKQFTYYQFPSGSKRRRLLTGMP